MKIRLVFEKPTFYENVLKIFWNGNIFKTFTSNGTRRLELCRIVKNGMMSSSHGRYQLRRRAGGSMNEDHQWNRALQQAKDDIEDDIEDADDEEVNVRGGQVIEVKSDGVSGIKCHVLPRECADRRRAVWRPLSEEDVPALQKVVNLWAQDLARMPKLRHMMATEINKLDDPIAMADDQGRGAGQGVGQGEMTMTIDLTGEEEEEEEVNEEEVIDLTDGEEEEPKVPMNTPMQGHLVPLK
jgi:hypothetical protein